MRSKGDSVQASGVLAAIALLAAGAAHAATGVWVGAVDGYWTNSQNWSVSPYPSGGDVALFEYSGNGRTVIDVSGVSPVGNLTFGSPDAAAYTVGASGPAAQTLVLERVSSVKMDARCGNSQVIHAALQLGEVNGVTTNTFRNDSLTRALTLAGDIVLPPTGGTGWQKMSTSPVWARPAWQGTCLRARSPSSSMPSAAAGSLSKGRFMSTRCACKEWRRS